MKKNINLKYCITQDKKSKLDISLNLLYTLGTELKIITCTLHSKLFFIKFYNLQLKNQQNWSMTN